jgi:hypothetical protein
MAAFDINGAEPSGYAIRELVKNCEDGDSEKV